MLSQQSRGAACLLPRINRGDRETGTELGLDADVAMALTLQTALGAALALKSDEVAKLRDDQPGWHNRRGAALTASP